MPTEIIARPVGADGHVQLRIESERIVEVRPFGKPRDGESLPWVGIGLYDLQINGFEGHEFSSPDITGNAVDRICRAVVATGTTRFLATVTTNASDVLEHAVAAIAAYRRQHPRCPIVGIHLEGPFISPENGPRGAHPAEHVRPPSDTLFDRLQRAAEGMIRL
ncbi:MAG: N-acetylglucosamine-6-phosphate deacetylase, partial [Planctomycetota bacterium]